MSDAQEPSAGPGRCPRGGSLEWGLGQEEGKAHSREKKQRVQRPCVWKNPPASHKRSQESTDMFLLRESFPGTDHVPGQEFRTAIPLSTRAFSQAVHPCTSQEGGPLPPCSSCFLCCSWLWPAGKVCSSCSHYAGGMRITSVQRQGSGVRRSNSSGLQTENHIFPGTSPITTLSASALQRASHPWRRTAPVWSRCRPTRVTRLRRGRGHAAGLRSGPSRQACGLQGQ